MADGNGATGTVFACVKPSAGPEEKKQALSSKATPAGDTKVKAPVPGSWFGTPAFDAGSFQPHAQFGFMCPVLKPNVDTP